MSTPWEVFVWFAIAGLTCDVVVAIYGVAIGVFVDFMHKWD